MSASARIRITGREIEISHPGPFGPGDMDRLLRRAFAHAETDSVHLEPAIRRFRIRLGAGDGDPRASYLLWTDEAIEFRRVPYDVRGTLERMMKSPELVDAQVDQWLARVSADGRHLT